MKYAVANYLNPTKEEKNEAFKVLGEWFNMSSNIGFDPVSLVELAYVILTKIEGKEETDELYKEVLLNTHSYILKDKNVQKVIEKAEEECDPSLLKTIIANAQELTNYDRYYGNYITPQSIIDLALRVLDIHSGEEAIDMCSGLGRFLENAYLSMPDASLYGIDIDPHSVLYSNIRTKIMKTNIKYELNNVFNCAKENRRFDKIFSNYPFGKGIRELGQGYYYLNDMQEKIPQISKATSSDWVFNSLTIDCLKDNGRAVCIMTNGATSNTIDKAIRKHFIEEKCIKAVIALPSKMFDTFGIPTTMIVFEKKDNNEILFIDASNICQKGRRTNSFTPDDIDQIISCFKKETDYCRKVSYKEVVGQDYNLTPSRYLVSYLAKTVVKDGTEFGNIIKNITRGASIKADDLDLLSTYEETDYQYLMLGNIQDGTIQKDLPFLRAINENLEKYCLKEGDLIFSKNGYPYKVAVVEHTDKKILANGNLFIIELDTKRANPYYIKALFESEKGIALLKSITVGSTIPNIGATQLKSLVIPLPSLKKQNEIAEEYLKMEDEIAVLRLRIKKIQERKNGLYDKLSEVDEVE